MDDFHAEWARARLAEEIQSREELDESLYLKQVHKEYLRQAKERVEKEKIMEIVANFHYRDAKKHVDGSFGTIEISPNQFNDCLAYMLTNKP